MAVKGQGQNTGVIKQVGEPTIGPRGQSVPAHSRVQMGPLPVKPGDITGQLGRLRKFADGNFGSGGKRPMPSGPKRPLPTTPPSRTPMNPLPVGKEKEDGGAVEKNKQISRKQQTLVKKMHSNSGKLNNKQKSFIQQGAAKRKAPVNYANGGRAKTLGGPGHESALRMQRRNKVKAMGNNAL